MSNYPDHWKVFRLGELISSLESGKRPKGGVQDIKSGIPSIGGEHLNSFGGFDFSKIKYVPEVFANNMTKGKIQVDDIIVVKDGATTAKTSLVRKDFPFKKAVINEHVFICRLIDHVDSKFIFYKLWSESGRKEILTDFRGAAQGGISSNFVNKVNIPLPPLPEQHRIVEKIEELFSELDNGIANLKEAKEQLKIYRQSVLKWAFEGRLTNEDVKDGVLPEGWKWVKVKDIGTVITGSTPSKSNLKYYGNDFPFYKPTDLEQGISTSSAIDNLSILGLEQARSIPSNSVLVTCIGATIGKTGLIKTSGSCNQQINAILPHKDIHPKFTYYQVISPDFQENIKENASSTTLPILNKSKFQELPFVLADIESQSLIINEIESRFSLADQMEQGIEESLQQAEALRQSILKSAFEGRLV